MKYISKVLTQAISPDGADALLFDRTVFTDDEMITAGVGQKPGNAWVTWRSAGRKHWLWRAVDQDGYALDYIVQIRRNTKAVKRLLYCWH